MSSLVPRCSPPKVLVHGIFGWGNRHPLLGETWPAALRTEPGWIVSECTGAVSSAHDRACELFAELYGGTVDYGAKHAKAHGHARHGRHLTAKWPGWSVDSPVDLVGHSYGGVVCLDLAQKLACDWFGVGSDQRWVRSLVTISAPLNGTTLVYLLGLSTEDHQTIRRFSAIHLGGALLATWWWLSLRISLLRYVYDFRLWQWEHAGTLRHLLQIWTMRHPAVASTDNPFHDLAPHRRWACNPSTADELSTLFLLSVSSHIGRRARFSRFPILGAFEVVLPRHSWNPIFVIVGLLLEAQACVYRWLPTLKRTAGTRAAHEPPIWSADWSTNDGIVNARSQHAPSQRGRQEPQEALVEPVEPSSLRRGVWYRLRCERDHLASKSEPMLRRIAAILDALDSQRVATPLKTVATQTDEMQTSGLRPRGLILETRASDNPLRADVQKQQREAARIMRDQGLTDKLAARRADAKSKLEEWKAKKQAEEAEREAERERVAKEKRREEEKKREKERLRQASNKKALNEYYAQKKRAVEDSSGDVGPSVGGGNAAAASSAAVTLTSKASPKKCSGSGGDSAAALSPPAAMLTPKPSPKRSIGSGGDATASSSSSAAATPRPSPKKGSDRGGDVTAVPSPTAGKGPRPSAGSR